MRTAQQSSSLATKFAVGEIADFTGVPDFYDAGSSKWLKTGAWVSGSLLPDAARATLKSAPANVALTDNAIFLNEHPRLNTITPLAKTASVAAIPMSNSVEAGRALVINSDGVRIVGYAQTTQNNTPLAGGNHLITSDGTTLFSWAVANSLTEFCMSSSADGMTWTPRTLTGQAVHAALNAAPMGPAGGSQPTNTTPSGCRFRSSTTYMNIAAWCGARHLLIGKNASNQYVAQRSADGVSWGGDETTAIIGNTSLLSASDAWWYRNGLNFFINIAGTSRKSSDGGVTWGGATGAATSPFFRVNDTDPARIAAVKGSSTDIRFSTNSGATWTTRTAPFSITATTTTLYGRGAVWVLTDMVTGAAYRTVDDGATWVQLFAPTGFNSSIQSVISDAYRWYMMSAAGNQVATSTDAVTWTVRNIINAGVGSDYAYTPCFIASLDANTILATPIAPGGGRLYSLDGGVTWTWASTSSSTAFTGDSAANLIASPVGVPLFVGGGIGSSDTEGKTAAAAISASDLALGGKFFRSSVTAATPLRTGALAYSRIA